MANKPQPPRLVLAENLIHLMKNAQLTGPQVAAKAHVDRKTVNNMINARFNPDLDNVEQVARVFGLTGWQLLRPGLVKDLGAVGAVEKLLDSFYNAGEEGKVSILKVAEMAAKYEENETKK